VINLTFDYVEEDPIPVVVDSLRVGAKVLTGSSNPQYARGEVVKVKRVGPRNNQYEIVKVKFPNGFFGWFGTSTIVQVQGVN